MASQPIHKVIITGTGRSGTTFLVELLTELGLDTGITGRNRSRKYYAHCNAGLEHSLADPAAPYIVKNPALCDDLPGILATGRFVIDHAFIPIRELEQAAASRIDVGGASGSVPGGLWGTSDPASQKAVLAEMFHRLLATLVENEIPFTLLSFPRFVRDAAYTRRCLAPLLSGIAEEQFSAAFARTARPELVHRFGPGAAPVARAPIPARRRSWWRRMLGRP
jgi:hypothetical protein